VLHKDDMDLPLLITSPISNPKLEKAKLDNFQKPADSWWSSCGINKFQ